MLGFAPPLAAVVQYFFGILMFVISLLLILLVLVQRGRGGGLAGAFGGMGGQSAFGTKAGDLFTRVTMGMAAFWIVLCILSIAVLNRPSSVFGPAPPAGSLGSPASDATSAPEDGLPAAVNSGTGLSGGTDAAPAETTNGDSSSPSAAPAARETQAPLEE